MTAEMAEYAKNMDIYLPLVICLLGLSPTIWFITCGLPAISAYISNRNRPK